MAKHYGGVEGQHTGCSWACSAGHFDWDKGLPYPEESCPHCNTQADEPVAGEPAPEEKPLSVDDAFIRLYRLIKMAHEQIDLLEQGADALSQAESRARLRGKDKYNQLMAEAREKSYSRGFDDGYQQGLTEGRDEDKSYFTGLLKGLKQGQEQGYKTAQAQTPSLGTVQVDVMSRPEVQETIRELTKQLVDAEERAYQQQMRAQESEAWAEVTVRQLRQELDRLNKENLKLALAQEQAFKDGAASQLQTMTKEIDKLQEQADQAIRAIKMLHPGAKVWTKGDCFFVELPSEEDI